MYVAAPQMSNKLCILSVDVADAQQPELVLQQVAPP